MIGCSKSWLRVASQKARPSSVGWLTIRATCIRFVLERANIPGQCELGMTAGATNRRKLAYKAKMG